MIAFICLFLPAVLCVWLFEHLHKTSLCRRQWLYRYCADIIFINGVCFAIKRFLLDTGSAAFCSLYADTTPTAALNYLIMAIPTAVIFAFAQIVLGKYADLSVEEQKDA